MKVTKLLLFCILAATIFSCSDDDNVVTREPGESPAGRKITNISKTQIYPGTDELTINGNFGPLPEVFLVRLVTDMNQSWNEGFGLEAYQSSESEIRIRTYPNTEARIGTYYLRVIAKEKIDGQAQIPDMFHYVTAPIEVVKYQLPDNRKTSLTSISPSTMVKESSQDFVIRGVNMTQINKMVIEVETSTDAWIPVTTVHNTQWSKIDDTTYKLHNRLIPVGRIRISAQYSNYDHGTWKDTAGYVYAEIKSAN